MVLLERQTKGRTNIRKLIVALHSFAIHLNGLLVLQDKIL